MVLLFLLIVGAVNLPFVHKFLTAKTNSVLESKGIPVHIGKITLLLNGKIGISELAFILPPKDTIIYAQKVSVDVSPLPLFSKKVIVNDITLNKAVINILTDTVTGNLQLMQAFNSSEKTNKKPEQTDETNEKKNPWDIDLKNVLLKNIRFVYSDLTGGIIVKQNLDKAEIDFNQFSLLKQQIDVGNVEIVKPEGLVAVWKGIEKPLKESESSAAWRFSLENLDITDLLFTLDQPDAGQQMDVSLKNGNISLEKLDLATREILVQKVKLVDPRVTFSGIEKPVEINEEKEKEVTFSIPVFSWIIKADQAIIDNGFLTIKTEGLTNDTTSNKWFPFHDLNASFSQIGISPGGYHLNMEKLSFGMSDELEIDSGSLQFDSDSLQNIALKINLSALINEKTSWLKKENHLKFLTDISGNSEVLKINQLGLESTSGLRINIDGKLLNPSQMQESEFDLHIASGTISRAQLAPIIHQFSPKTELPSFKPFTFSGSIRNSVIKPVFSLAIKSESGQIDASGSFNANNTSGELQATLTNILLSEMMGETYPENFTGNIQLQGKIGSGKMPQGSGIIQIDSVRFNNKTTKNISINASAENDLAEISIITADTALNLNLNGHFMWDKSNAYSGDLKGYFDVDLTGMNLYSKPFTGKGNIDGSFGFKPDGIDASIDLDNLSLSNDKSNTVLTSTSFNLNANDTIIVSDFNSDFIKTHFESRASIKEFTTALDSIRLKNIVNLDSANFINLGAFKNIEYFEFTSTIRHDSVFNLFYPDSVLNFSNINVDIGKKGIDSITRGSITTEWIVFNKIKSINPAVLARFDHDRLTFEIKTEGIVEEEIQFGKLGLKVDVFPSYLSSNLTVEDKEGNVLHQIGFDAERKNDLVIFKSTEPDWIINKNPWTLSPPEFITWNQVTKKLIAKLDMHFDDRYIGFKGENTESLELTLNNIEFKNFALPFIVDIMPDGKIDGKVKYHKTQNDNLDANLQFSKFNWKNVSFNSITINGKLVADSTGVKESDILIIADDSISTSIQFVSNSILKEFQLKSKFNNLHFQIIEPFVKEFASNLHGSTDGNITIVKKNSKMAFDGDIKFNDFGLKVIPLKTWLTIPDNKIEIQQNKFIFNNFTVIDSLKRPLTINGNINFINKDDINADLKVEADKIQLMNTTESKDSPLFGSIIVKSGLSIKGSLFSPTIKGNIELESGTNLTYQLIQDLSVKGSQSDVVFATITDSLGVIYPENENKGKTTKMPMIETTIRINPRSVFNVKVEDLYTIDIAIAGDGLLNYNMLPNNTMSLNGDYQISSGNCKLKITGWPLKNFNISRGSSVSWNGSVENPVLNLEATTKVRGSYTNPIDNKSRVVDFVVSMKLKNKLSDLEIIFGVQSSDQYITSVLSSLSSDEMMRQAVNLLLFETIEIPGIESSSNYLSSQINSFWESQLNSLASTKMNKTKLSFGIDSYNQSTAAGGKQEKTSFTYEMERKFMNDRATVKISGKLNDYNEGAYQTNSLFENFIFEYALDSLNTKNLKLYQKRDYEDMLEGEVVKYGAGFLYRKNYKKLSDIWQRKKRLKLENKKDSIN